MPFIRTQLAIDTVMKLAEANSLTSLKTSYSCKRTFSLKTFDSCNEQPYVQTQLAIATCSTYVRTQLAIATAKERIKRLTSIYEAIATKTIVKNPGSKKQKRRKFRAKNNERLYTNSANKPYVRTCC